MDEEAGGEAGGAGGAVAAPVASATPVDLGGTPAAAPAATAVEPAKAPAAEKPTYDKSGDPGLDFAIDFVANLGITPDDPAYKAAEQGNFDLLRVKLATMGDKARGFDQVLAVAEKSYKDLADKHDAKVAERASLVYEAAGGEESWKAISDWAKQAAEPSEKEEINAMLNGGPLAAKAAVAYLKSMYSASSDTSNPPAAAVPANAGAAKGAGNGPLSPTEYKAAIQDLSRKLGPQIDGSPEYKVLQARRQAWRG